MLSDTTYYGPVWVTGGEHKGKLGFVDDYDENDADQDCGIVYLEGEEPTAGEYVLIPIEHLDEPPEAEQEALEARIWNSAGHGPKAKA